MITVYHSFCGVPVQTAAPCPMPEDAQGAAFRTEETAPLLQITLEPVETLPEPAGELCGRAGEKTVWRSGTAITRRTRDVCRPIPHIQTCYDLTDPSRVRALIRREDWAWAAGTKYLWTGLAVNQLLLHFRTLFFHAAYVDWQGKGILFTAPSGTGKSTQAELWRKYRGAAVINGDKAAVSLGKTPVLHSVPFSGTSGICKNSSTPLAAVVVLSQAPENTVEPMGPTQALAAICGNVFVEQTVPEEWSLALNLLLDLAQTVPIYHLACTPDERAVEKLEQVII